MRGFIAKKLIAQVSSRANRKHYPSPFAMIDLWHKHGANESSAYEAEARSMAKLIFAAPLEKILLGYSFFRIN